MSEVTLRLVDETELARLLEVAVADAVPGEVMPPVAGPPGWTEERRAAFYAHYGAEKARAYAFEVNDRIVGAGRLAPADSPGSMEAGVWLARSARGRGYGTQMLHLMTEEARALGATAIIAETTTANLAATGALRNIGAKLWEDPESGSVHATLRI